MTLLTLQNVPEGSHVTDVSDLRPLVTLTQTADEDDSSLTRQENSRGDTLDDAPQRLTWT